MPVLRNGSTVTDRRLDRLEHFDDASREFPVTALLTADQRQPVTQTWTIDSTWPVLDQGDEGACTGFGTTNDLRFNPVPIAGLDYKFAHDVIYWGAQKIDPWAGGSYPGAKPVYEGSSVLAAVKTAAKLGYYGQYRWAFGENDLALAISYQGPAILGLRWTSGMFKPNSSGFLKPTGTDAGGHCLLCIGINVEDDYYILYNSWGPTWGNKGMAKISRKDMANRLSTNGEACIPVTRFAPTH